MPLARLFPLVAALLLGHGACHPAAADEPPDRSTPSPEGRPETDKNATTASATELPGLPLTIPVGQSRCLALPSVETNAATFLLELRARAHYRSTAGSNYFLRLTINGQPVTAAKTRRVSRLRNRPLVSPVAPNLKGTWCGGDRWRLVYAPDFEAASEHTFYEGNPYQIVLDVTDLLGVADRNTLVLENIARKHAVWEEGEGQVVVDRVVLRRLDVSSATTSANAPCPIVINSGTPAAPPARYVARIAPSGGIVVEVGDRTWRFASALSRPGGTLCSLSARGDASPTAQPATTPCTAQADAKAGGKPSDTNTDADDWRVRVQSTSNGGLVVGKCPDYELTREVRFLPQRIEIADKLANRHTDRPLGMLIRHETGLPADLDPVVRLGGNPDPAINDYYSTHNPSVHVTAVDHSIGMLCEDDVLRNQARLFCDMTRETAGMRTEMFYLPPGGEYTLRWSIYPVAGLDYFDFINLVRQDWGANFTVEGPWTFFNPYTVLETPLETLREKLLRSGVRYAIYCGGWVDYRHDPKRIGFGVGVTDPYWNDFRVALAKAATKLREAVPQLRVLVYYDTQRDTSEAGKIRFADSQLVRASGSQVTTNWGGRFSLTRSMVATPDNSFGKAMFEVADGYLDELGADGLYWDEMEAVAYGIPLITYNMADGHSCILNLEDYTIRQPVGLTTLLGKPHRMAVIERVRANGGHFLGNGPPCTRATLESGVPRMVEIQHNDHWCYEGNLATPLGYLSSMRGFAAVRRAIRLGCLPVGTRYDYDHEISPYLFPFTPIELHHGYLLGRERIVAIHSGSYGWPGQKCLVRVWHFDGHGKLTQQDFATSVRDGARTSVELGEEEAVVLERLPVTLEPDAGATRVEQVRYGADGLALRFAAPDEATLLVSDGPLVIGASTNYRVAREGGAAQTITSENGVLRVRLTGSGRVSIEPVDR